jgi:uncharacterized membrane protein YpjA
MDTILKIFERPRENARLIWLIVAVNVAGVLYGWYYYENQFLETPVYLWMFIPDCPNSALFVAIALILIVKDRKNDFIGFLASTNALKYGIWTCFVILFYHDYFLSLERRSLYIGMFVTHMLLALEAIPLAYTVKFNRYCILAMLWLFLNDFMDYVVGTHPYMPLEKIEFVEGFTVFLSFLSFVVCYIVSTVSEN